MATDSLTSSQLEELLGDNAKTLLDHKCTTIDASMLHLPGPDFNERIVADSDRSAQVMRNLQQMWDHGRLGGDGYNGNILRQRYSQCQFHVYVAAGAG
ncbi:MAG: hypothetical protein WCK00_16065 [Deltaproteobacteria bacterium]